MEIKKLLNYVDHTLLKPNCTWQEIKQIIDDGIKYGVASVCIPPSFVKQAASEGAGKVKICTVIGFPNGYNTTEVKAYEASDAVKNGADEIDMVINSTKVQEGDFQFVKGEIIAVKKAIGSKILKVIVETCYLSEQQLITLSQTVSEAKVDFIKTSTGFGSRGASFRDVEIMSKHVYNGVQIKAAGGISTLSDAEKFIELGATRLGTSRIVKIVKEQNLI